MQFLIVYERRAGKILEQSEYQNDQSEAALQARLSKEMEYRERPDVEVVLLGASSRSEILRTHSRYFKNALELAENQIPRAR